MASPFFIPKQINVGYQKRSDTYTEKLAYIIYFDEKGKLRKETSWNSWRHKGLGNDIHDNVPTSGFVLNKKAGGYDTGWNHRQTYVRVFDPRGFEFEISIQNLLYILENATSTKGKGLEGDFVYGWSGTELVLIPCEAPDYKELEAINALRHAGKKIGAKDMIIGATYLTKANEEYIYLGKFPEYTYSYERNPITNNYRETLDEVAKPRFWFYERKHGKHGIHTIASVSGRFIDVPSTECVTDYAELMDMLSHERNFSPLDFASTEYVPYTEEELREILTYTENTYRWGTSKSVWIGTSGEDTTLRYREDSKDGLDYYTWQTDNPRYDHKSYRSREPLYFEHKAATLTEVIQQLAPHKRRMYLVNGQLYKED